MNFRWNVPLSIPVPYPEAARSLVEDEAYLLTFYKYPQSMRQRTNQIDVFTTETSCLTIVWATIQDIRMHPHRGGVRLYNASLQ